MIASSAILLALGGFLLWAFAPTIGDWMDKKPRLFHLHLWAGRNWELICIGMVMIFTIAVLIVI